MRENRRKVRKDEIKNKRIGITNKKHFKICAIFMVWGL